MNNVTLDELNSFFLRFERDETVTIPELEDSREIPAKLLSSDEVEELIGCLKSKKTRDTDGISSMLIKTNKKELIETIKDILNLCISEQRIPQNWKNIKITPIPKNNQKVIKNAKYVRPVGQTSLLLKLLEHYTLKELRQYVTHSDPFQFAYKKESSTTDAICVVQTLIAEILDRSEEARVLFLDYSSAFNTIARPDILSLLIEKFRLPNPLIRLMHEYLDTRQQYVELNAQSSQKKDCNVGVIQSAILSPFLFTMITDSLRKEHEKINIIKFADDTTVIAGIGNDSDFKDYQSTVRNVELWSEKYNLELNPTKTKEVILKNRNKKGINRRVMVCNKEIIPSKTAKHLGIYIDDKMNYDEQVECMLKKIKQKMGHASRLLKHTRSAQAVETFVKICILPVITYGLFVYEAFLSKKLKKKIERIIKYIAIVSKVPKRVLLKQIENENRKHRRKAFLKMQKLNHPLNHLAKIERCHMTGRIKINRCNHALLQNCFAVSEKKLL